MRRLRPLLPLTLLVLLGACGLSPSRHETLYVLPGGSFPGISQAPQAWSLRVVRPNSSDSLARRGIAVIPDGQSLRYYAEAGWSETPADLLHDRLLDVFRASGVPRALASDGLDAQTDLRLESDLRAFQSEYQGDTPYAVIRLDAYLVDSRSRRILATQRFEARQAAGDTQVSAVVRALGEASDALALQVQRWTQANAGHR